MSELPEALVIEDMEEERNFLVRALSHPDLELVRYFGCGPFHVQASACARQAMDYLASTRYDLVLLDLQLPFEIGQGEDIAIGKELLTKIPKMPGTVIVVVTLFPTARNALDVLTGGAVDFIDKLLNPDAKEIFGRSVRAYQRLCQERRNLWHLAGRNRAALREACLLRTVSDNFTRAAAEVLGGVAASCDTLKALLKGRFGIDPKNIGDDEIAKELLNADQAMQRGAQNIRELRASAPIELERNEVVLHDWCSGLTRELASLAATRRLRIDEQVEDKKPVKVYSRDLHDSAMEVLQCAIQHAQRDTAVQVTLRLDESKHNLHFSVRFRRSETPMTGIDAAGIPVYEIEHDTVRLVTGLVNRMGGEMTAGCDEDGIYSIRMEVPVEI